MNKQYQPIYNSDNESSTSSSSPIYIKLPTPKDKPLMVVVKDDASEEAAKPAESKHVSSPKLVEREPSSTDLKEQRSFDEIKEEYTTWLKKQNSKPGRKTKTKNTAWFLVAGVIGLTILSLFVISAKIKSASEINKRVAVVEPVDDTPDVDNSDDAKITDKKKIVNVTPIDADHEQAQSIKPEQTTDLAQEQALVKEQKESTEPKKKLSLDLKEEKQVSADKKEEVSKMVKPAITKEIKANPAPSVNTIVASNKNEKNIKSKPEDIVVAEKKSNNQLINNAPITPSSLPNEVTKVDRREEPPVALTSLVDVKSNYISQGRFGITSVDITLTNRSEEVLKLVAVNVYYYNINRMLVNHRTLYFSNVQPGSKITAPGFPNDHASYVACQTALINNGNGAIYYARQ